MLIIRLQRTGRENLLAYRIVVAEKARPVKGGVMEHVGHYLPTAHPPSMVIKKERIEHWISQGATASDTVARLLTKQGIKGLEKYIVRYAKRRPKDEVPAKSATALSAETPAHVATETTPAA